MKQIITDNENWQQPKWEDEDKLLNIKSNLSKLPPLIKCSEVIDLYKALEQVYLRKAVVFQAGDCAERINESSRPEITKKLTYLHEMTDTLSKLLSLPVITVGRIGGQYAKPRSQQYEIVNDVVLPVWRGDCINCPEPNSKARRNDPGRMLLSYHAAAKTLSTIRKYNNKKGSGDFHIWTSHEALLLDYESTQIRAANNLDSYLASTHWPWIGIRTLTLGGPHIELLSKVLNPVACKIDGTVTPDVILNICKKLNPNKVPGRLTLIARFGCNNFHKLERLIGTVTDSEVPVLWMCDPMHGNTHKDSSGYKYRDLSEITEEVIRFQHLLSSHNIHCAGLHIEATGNNITECNGAGYSLNEHDKKSIICDPRLNKAQTLNLFKQWKNSRSSYDL